MHIMYLTPEEQRVAIYEAVKTNDMSSLNPEAVRTYHIKDSWFKSPNICHRSSPAASIRRKTVGLFSCLPEKDGMAISQASLPDDFREVCELCMGYERDGGKLMLTDISGKELSDAYMFRYKSGDGLAHPLLFYPVSVTWTLKGNHCRRSAWLRGCHTDRNSKDLKGRWKGLVQDERERYEMHT